MSERRPDRSPQLRAIAFLTLSLALLLLPARFTSSLQAGFLSVVWPAQLITIRTSRGLAFFVSGLFGRFRSAHDPEELRKTIALQQATIARQQNMIRRLTEQLRQISAFKSLTPLQEIQAIIPAQVTGIELSPTRAVIDINAGTSHGAVVGSAVLYGDIAVGTVIQAGPWASRVKLLTQVGNRTRAVVVRTGNKGILEGVGGGKFVLLYVPREADIKVDDDIVAPTTSEFFPPNILLGVITSVQTDPSDPSHRISVAPTVDCTSLEDVIVITRAEQPPPPTESRTR